ncbi:Signal transduction histidine kinase [Selenomonas sp. GACV-9]|uniref:ATP-binding response regulator n=1 Tax=Selenomonas sp. GACV-9 TaxID=3158782 RepID=UPI0008ED6017|nr:Signal transduction histidine kinase [Selenomonas ruminantium]
MKTKNTDSQDLMTELLENMDTIVYVCDVETQQLLYANKAAIKKSNCHGDYRGKTCYNYMFGRNSVCADCQLRKMHLGTRQELVRHDTSNDTYLNIEKKGISWHGRLACAHFINDVTDRKRNEKMLAAEHDMAAKAAFISNVSHDMRTPLNGIIGFTELAMRSDGEKREEYLEKIRTTGKFMLSLINETLDLSKIASGKLEMEPENISIDSLLDTVVVAAHANAEIKRVNFRIDLENMWFQDVYIDPLKLQKVLMNLLSNAIKYTPAGGTVTLSMEGPLDFGDGYNCHIVVSDNGVGMTEDFLPKLFQPFSQERTKLTRNLEGTGLGMSIVKQLVGILGGRIDVESAKDKGTRFDLWLTLPPGKPQPKEQAVGNVSYPNLAGRCVLLCEDNEINRELVENLLLTQKMKVIAVADGQQGVEAFAQSELVSIAAVLMDMRMPVMDGIKATEAIRAMSRADAQRVPIIALSGEDEAADRQQAQAAGMTDYLLKPVDVHELLRRLSELLPAEESE